MINDTGHIPSYNELYDVAPQEIKDYIDKCKSIPQSPKWHPEGDVDIHNRIVYNRAVKHGDINLILAAFFHDLGKVDTTALNKHGSFSAHGHEHVSARLATKYKQWIESFKFGSMQANGDLVHDIVKDHMRIKHMPEMRKIKQDAMKQLPHFNDLNIFTKFDSMSTLTPDELDL